jgi:hypothetical protein
MADETQDVETTTTTETGKDGTAFDAARAQRTIEQLREEIKASKATAKELSVAQARLKEIEDKDKSEVERLAGTARETSEKLTAAEQRARDLAIRLSVERAARKLGFIDEDDAYRLIDRSTVEMDDGGDPTNVDALLAALAKAKPHLVRTDGEKPPLAKGTPQTPKPAATALTKEQDIEQRHQKLEMSGNYPRF